MSVLLLVAPTHHPTPDFRDALRTSHWIAVQNATAARAAGFSPIELFADQAHRSEVEARLDEGVMGLAAFGHGGFHRPGRPSHDRSPVNRSFFGQDNLPALDGWNLHRLRGRWLHAFACHSAGAFAQAAIDAGVETMVGYHTALQMDWEPETLPEELRRDLSKLVTTVTLALASGERDQEATFQRLFDLAEPIIDWCNEQEGASRGLDLLVSQLTSRSNIRWIQAAAALLPDPPEDEARSWSALLTEV